MVFKQIKENLIHAPLIAFTKKKKWTMLHETSRHTHSTLLFVHILILVVKSLSLRHCCDLNKLLEISY